MKTIYFLIIAAALATTSVCSAGDPETKAQAAAETWLAVVDAGRYEESWSSAAAIFKGAVTQEQWKGAVAAVRGPLGKLVSRKLKEAKYTKSLPGAPDGEYVVIQYDTEFENKKAAVETVVPMLEKDGQWKVSGYFIK